MGPSEHKAIQPFMQDVTHPIASRWFQTALLALELGPTCVWRLIAKRSPVLRCRTFHTSLRAVWPSRPISWKWSEYPNTLGFWMLSDRIS